MKQTETALRSALIEAQLKSSAWNIHQGELGDLTTHGVYLGTRAEANALIVELNASRRHEDPCDGVITWKGDEYWAEETSVIRAAADILKGR